MNSEPALVGNQPTLTVVNNNPASEPAEVIDVLADKIRSLEQWYAVDFERRVASITELLKRRLAEESQAQLNAELEQRTRQIRQEYEERLYAKVAEWQTQQATFEKEIEVLKSKLPSGNLLEEIASVEAGISRYAEAYSAGMESQPSSAAALGRLFQGKFEEIEMRAYLKGLKFRT